jgi:hypothetical protein
MPWSILPAGLHGEVDPSTQLSSAMSIICSDVLICPYILNGSHVLPLLTYFVSAVYPGQACRVRVQRFDIWCSGLEGKVKRSLKVIPKTPVVYFNHTAVIIFLPPRSCPAANRDWLAVGHCTRLARPVSSIHL